MATSAFSVCGGRFLFVAHMIFGKSRPRLVLGLEHGPKAICEVWKAHSAQGLGCIQQRL